MFQFFQRARRSGYDITLFPLALTEKFKTTFISGYWRKLCPRIKALGMESKEISDEDIKTSSQYNKEEGGAAARLHIRGHWLSGGAWVPVNNNKTHGPQEWLQVNVGKVPTIVTHVATQGRPNHFAWVKKYKLQYLDDSNELVNFRAEGAKTDFTVKSSRSV